VATKAAYRFFENERMTAAELLAPHQWETQKQMVGHGLVLAVQGTSYLNYTHHPTTLGLGMIGGQQVGLVRHRTMAFTPGGLLLGLIPQRSGHARKQASFLSPMSDQLKQKRATNGCMSGAFPESR
jgi:hypothetical protein